MPNFGSFPRYRRLKLGGRTEDAVKGCTGIFQLMTLLYSLTELIFDVRSPQLD